MGAFNTLKKKKGHKEKFVVRVDADGPDRIEEVGGFLRDRYDIVVNTGLSEQHSPHTGWRGYYTCIILGDDGDE
jgi:hypothetical protein